jgi:hypothetical protein
MAQDQRIASARDGGVFPGRRPAEGGGGPSSFANAAWLALVGLTIQAGTPSRWVSPTGEGVAIEGPRRRDQETGQEAAA